MLPPHRPLRCFRLVWVTRLYVPSSAWSAATSAGAAEFEGSISLSVRQRIGGHAFSRIQLTGTRYLVGSSSGMAPRPGCYSVEKFGRQLTRFTPNQLVGPVTDCPVMPYGHIGQDTTLMGARPWVSDSLVSTSRLRSKKSMASPWGSRYPNQQTPRRSKVSSIMS